MFRDSTFILLEIYIKYYKYLCLIKKYLLYIVRSINEDAIILNQLKTINFFLILSTVLKYL